jgi:hypothetical protein
MASFREARVAVELRVTARESPYIHSAPHHLIFPCTVTLNVELKDAELLQHTHQLNESNNAC